MQIKKHIPNLLTLANLTCGALGVILLMSGEMSSDGFRFTTGNNLPLFGYDAWTATVILMLLAGVFDFFDGFVARLLGVQGELGKQLDSLADMVTFGVLPGLLMYQWMLSTEYGLLAYSGIAIILMSAYRLAIFNISTNQSLGFIGVPTPANAYMIGGLVFWFNQLNDTTNVHDYYFYAIISVISALLLVSPFSMIAFKFKKDDLQFELKRKVAVVLLTILSLVILGLKGISVSILCYIVISITTSLFKGTKKEQTQLDN